ncbi:MAG: nitroreductase family protein [bacterium]
MDLLEGIYSRRSIRRYTGQAVDREQLIEIIKAGTWAPSGLNNQPWRFVLIREESTRSTLAELTKYGQIIRMAPACIGVFLDKRDMYHEIKDYQAVGACLQNMLLAAHALGLGAVWLGEIMKHGDRIRELLGLPQELEFMAVIAVGHPQSRNQVSSRKGLPELFLKEY